jgi:hypothetical protein
MIHSSAQLIGCMHTLQLLLVQPTVVLAHSTASAAGRQRTLPQHGSRLYARTSRSLLTHTTLNTQIHTSCFSSS